MKMTSRSMPTKFTIPKRLWGSLYMVESGGTKMALWPDSPHSVKMRWYGPEPHGWVRQKMLEWIDESIAHLKAECQRKAKP